MMKKFKSISSRWIAVMTAVCILFTGIMGIYPVLAEETNLNDWSFLGEGSSEDVLFDYLDLVIHPEWMRDYRIQYMGCLGKNTMPFYFLFLNHLGIKTVCLYDADKNTNPVHASYAKAFAEYEKENGHLYAKMALNPDLEHVLDIVPDYKLLSIEKPVNIYHNTFATDNIKDKVSKLSDVIKVLFDKMEKEK